MPDVHTHEIVLRGRFGHRLLGPFLDDFTVADGSGPTRLVGTVRDASHLHGLVAYLASINAELISIIPLVPSDTPILDTPTLDTPTLETRSTS